MGLKTSHVAIAGLGLIGGSLALRLVRSGVKVTAWNHREYPYENARKNGIECVKNLEDLTACRPDALVLCTPLKAIAQIASRLEKTWDENIVLTDVGSVKKQVREDIKKAGLGEFYVGAHPMAGTEHSGFGSASHSLLDSALWAITVDETTDANRFCKAADMIINGCGNQAIVLDDDAHDRAAAMISHMPHAVATAMANTLAQSEDLNIANALSAGSWRDMTRVSLTDPQRTRAMIEENSQNVAKLLRGMASSLAGCADALECSDAAEKNAFLCEFFASADKYRDWKKKIANSAAAYEICRNAEEKNKRTIIPDVFSRPVGKQSDCNHSCQRDREAQIPDSQTGDARDQNKHWQNIFIESALAGERIISLDESGVFTVSDAAALQSFAPESV